MPINSRLAVQQEVEISPVEALGYMCFFRLPACAPEEKTGILCQNRGVE
jgi:hypothetical protein